jgi:type IV secretory pathway TraG/TraD family ATPase VirD4
MSNESNKGFNEVILLVVSPPFIFILFNIIRPYVGLTPFDRFPSENEFENSFHLGPFPFWIFPVFYGILFYFRDNPDIYWMTKLAVCASGVIAILDPWTQAYTFPVFISYCLFTGAAMYFLFLKETEKKKTDIGKFPLFLDKKGKSLIPTKALHENVQIVGGTGTGKTHYVIKPFIQQTIEQRLGCFVLDVKTNMRKDVAYYAKKANDRSYKNFTLADPKHSHSYNPLFGDNPDAIANRVFTALYYNPKNTEPYYVELADAFLHNLIGLLKKAIKTLTFQDLLGATQEVDTFRTIAQFCAKYPETTYARYFRDQWLSKSPKDRRNDLSGLINKLQRFCNSEWSYLLNVKDPDVRMSEVVNRGEIFLFSPDSARYPEDAKPLCILAMMDLAEQLADRYKETPEAPFRVFLDEFYNLAYPKFIDFINKCREAQVNLFLAHQSMGDLRGVSPEFLEQVMNTASNKIILRVNDPDTAEIFARQFGTEQDKDYKVESYGADGKMSGYSRPQVEKFRFHPNRIKELRVGQAIVRLVGDYGVKVFPVNLREAETAPANFYPLNNLDYRRSHSDKNESSISDVIQGWGGNPDKGPKNDKDKMGDEDAA